MWAALGGRDWIRFFPRGRLGGLGHGPSPLRRGFGAVRFATGPIRGHCSYYAPGSDLVLYYGDRSYFPGIVVLGRLDGDAAAQIADLEGTVTATVAAR